MTPPPLRDAATLAAGATGWRPLSPRDVDLHATWLDLRADSWLVARNKIANVVQRLAPCLGLQDEARLVLSAGACCHPSDLLRDAVHALGGEGHKALPVGLVRGQSVLDRLEEFLLAGVEIREPDAPHRSLVDFDRMPVQAFAVAPASVLHAALGSAAKVIAVAEANAEQIEHARRRDPAKTTTTPVRVHFVRDYEALIAVIDPRPIDELRAALAPCEADGCELRVGRQDDVALVRLTSPIDRTIERAIDRAQLVLRNVVLPLRSLIRRTFDTWQIDVPTEMLEFAVEVRPASEWFPAVK